MNINERAAAVLQQIEQRLAFALDDEQTALRCLDAAIDKCLDCESWDSSISATYIREDAEEILTTICDQWEGQP